MNGQGGVERYKAHLAIKGYKQQAGVDYDGSLCSGCNNGDNSTSFVSCCST